MARRSPRRLFPGRRKNSDNYGRSRARATTHYIHSDRLFLALDAVRDAPGSTVCASGGTCVPINLFGQNSFSAGWGLYSELPAKELGWYANPDQDFGRLPLALMRAALRAVDTGLHRKRWTREQAVHYLDRNMPSTHYDNQREIDRYSSCRGKRRLTRSAC